MPFLNHLPPWPLGHPSICTLMSGPHLPREEEDFINKNPFNYQQITKQDEIQAPNFFAVKVDSFSNLIDSIQKALWKDSQYRIIFPDLGKGSSVQDYSLDSSSQLLLFKYWGWFQMTPQFNSVYFKRGMTLV
ncbi:hypothetical protein O181_030897 [Austropuccinia psidii MF-1]|uniref:Uncharacterized protein n=1 Tax=Austropuccinia psidii MF-1 TaxID=1389203 RepID=A0A9Q3CWL6_9BASI|nr:hypothetical protein [Austropuccinia psidii MF-1]